jgi:hypothetical protein
VHLNVSKYPSRCANIFVSENRAGTIPLYTNLCLAHSLRLNAQSLEPGVQGPVRTPLSFLAATTPAYFATHTEQAVKRFRFGESRVGPDIKRACARLAT